MQMSLLNTALKFSLNDMTVTREHKPVVFCTLLSAEIRTRKLGTDRLALTNSFTGLKSLFGKRLHLSWGQVISSKSTGTYRALQRTTLRPANFSTWKLSSCSYLFFLTPKFSELFSLLELGPLTTYTHAASCGRVLQYPAYHPKKESRRSSQSVLGASFACILYFPLLLQLSYLLKNNCNRLLNFPCFND